VKRFIVLIILAVAACRGEPVPRDNQNAPPDMTHPPQTATQSPPQHGMGKAPPQPSSGVEGTAAPYEPVTPPAQPQQTTMPDTPPVTTATTPTTTT